jgi:hypothetical protein
VEVFIAARLLTQRTGSFSVDDLRREIETRFGDTRPGVMTHITAHCVANAPKNAETVSNYLWRLPDGTLCPFDPTRERPHPSRIGARSMPDRGDVPTAYLSLLSMDNA